SRDSILSLQSWGLIARRYFRAYQSFMVLIPLLAAPGLFVAWRRRRAKGRVESASNMPPRTRPAGPLATALALTAGPIALHHVILFSHTVIHDFDMVKGASVLGLAFGLAIASLDRVARPSSRAWLRPAALVLIAAVAAGGGMALAYRRDFTPTSGSRAVGTAIREANVPPDQIVFVGGGSFYKGSAAIYYAGRNITGYSPENARYLIGASGADGGVLFVVSADGMRVDSVKRIGRDGEIVGGE
ncbi:MAG: hypothetical protein Q7W16_09295, partial [Coriobacteriia bacterium]|nr:hypothetical protein [Coriobacteriia bacterium]